MLNVQKSNNLILNSALFIVIYFSHLLCGNTGDCYCTPVLVGNHIQTPHCGAFVLYNFLVIIFMDVIYPQ